MVFGKRLCSDEINMDQKWSIPEQCRGMSLPLHKSDSCGVVSFTREKPSSTLEPFPLVTDGFRLSFTHKIRAKAVPTITTTLWQEKDLLSEGLMPSDAPISTQNSELLQQSQ